MKKQVILLLLTALLLSGCNSGNPNTDTTPTAEDSAIEESTAVTLFSKEASYPIVRSEENLDYMKAGQVLYKTAKDKDLAVTFTTDFLKKDETPPENEILIGKTNRPQSDAAYEKIGEGEFILAFLDGKLVVAGYTPELTTLAVEKLSTLFTEDGLTLPADFCEIYEAEPTIEYTEFQNPVCDSGADPWVIRDGAHYYYCYSGGNGVCVNEIESLDKITAEGGTKVYTAPDGTMYSSEYWAPELHKIGDEWYIYVAADDGDNFNHRMYVLRGTGSTPLEPFEMVGKITDPTDKWAIDGTVLQYEDELYFIWSGWEGDDNVAQNIYIAHMSDPCTIDSERVLLSKPDKKWEKLGGRPSINEGPVALVKDGTVHIIYSGSGSWSDYYCLGQLTCRNGDFLNAESWVKSDKSIFSKTTSVFGPGHCSFTTAEDGSDWIVYHANLVSGSGWGGRSVWTQPIEWDGDTPVLGSPLSPDTVLKLPRISYTLDHITLKK